MQGKGETQQRDADETGIDDRFIFNSQAPQHNRESGEYG